MTLKDMPKAGDVLIAKKERGGIMEGSIIEGNEYVVQSIDQDGEAVIIGDDGTRWYIGGYEFKWFTLKESEAPPVEASPSVIELLSNLALRLTKVEAELKPDVADDMDNGTTTQSERIESVCNEVRDLLIRKNHDYGDSFSKQYAKYGVMSGLIRMDDKIRRLETLVGGEEAQVSESIEDTIADLAGYALLTLVELRKTTE